jgi:NAD(P)-dependent dehydrogenase (short-subunit alcohol dehydrogenase family)
MTGRLAGKTCIITGSGGAMGREAARLFAREGALVVGCDINADAALQTLQNVRAEGGNMVSLHPLDLSAPQQASELARFAAASGGRIDVLYNNGGGVKMAWLADMSAEDWSFTLRNELDIIFFACKAVWPFMSGQKSGSIVNVASVSGKIAYRSCRPLPTAQPRAASWPSPSISRWKAAPTTSASIRSVRAWSGPHRPSGT